MKTGSVAVSDLPVSREERKRLGHPASALSPKRDEQIRHTRRIIPITDCSTRVLRVNANQKVLVSIRCLS